MALAVPTRWVGGQAVAAVAPGSRRGGATRRRAQKSRSRSWARRWPAGAPAADTIPGLLSATGCTDSADITRPYSGLVPYDVNAPFWSDGAAKDRHIGLPNGTTITRTLNDDWVFPNGTVIVKNFRLNGNLIETRHLMRHPDGVWAGYTYEWNAQQTEATRVQGG